MTAKRRVRRVFSVKEELLKKSREAALAAVQIFNNPNITFKAETYVVLMIVAWTYLLHAYYRERGIEYRYYSGGPRRRKFDRTRAGAFKRWELERCLNAPECPLDRVVGHNLRFMVLLRHEIEHQMTTRIDDLLSARFQACCINYHDAISSLFGPRYGIAQHLAVSLQFASMEREQVALLKDHPGLPAHIRQFIEGFDGQLVADDYNDQKFAFRVMFVAKTANHPNQADQVITFVKPGSAPETAANQAYALIKETDRPKFLAKSIVAKMHEAGYSRFRIHDHTMLWKERGAKAPASGFGIAIEGTWFWYASWVAEVERHCVEKASQYR